MRTEVTIQRACTGARRGRVSWAAAVAVAVMAVAGCKFDESIVGANCEEDRCQAGDVSMDGGLPTDSRPGEDDADRPQPDVSDGAEDTGESGSDVEVGECSDGATQEC